MWNQLKKRGAPLTSGRTSSQKRNYRKERYLKMIRVQYIEYQRKLQAFGKTLTLLMNLYITIIIVGTIFFIVVSSLMGAVGGVSIATIKVFHYITVFAGLPLITAALILMIKSSSPWAE